MGKKLRNIFIFGAVVGAIAALFSSRTVRKEVKKAVKGKEKSKLDAIREILDDKKESGFDKAEQLRDMFSQQKNNK